MVPDIAALTAALAHSVEVEETSPMDRLKEVISSLVDGCCGYSTPDFIAFLSEHSALDDYRSDDFDPKQVGHWRRGYNIIPAEHLDTIVDVYNNFQRDAISPEIRRKLQLIRRQACSDKSGKLIGLFKPRDRNNIQRDASDAVDPLRSIYSYWTIQSHDAEKELDDL